MKKLSMVDARPVRSWEFTHSVTTHQNDQHLELIFGRNRALEIETEVGHQAHSIESREERRK
jgi:hypothetical protein